MRFCLFTHWVYSADNSYIFNYYYSNLIRRNVSRRVDIQNISRDAKCVRSRNILAVIQCVKSNYCIDDLFIIHLYLFLKKNSVFKYNYAGKFDVSCGLFSNFISFVLRYSNTDSESVGLIWLSVSDGQKIRIARNGQKNVVQRVYYWYVNNRVFVEFPYIS